MFLLAGGRVSGVWHRRPEIRCSVLSTRYSVLRAQSTIISNMKIFLACPAPPHSRKGNRVTAVRWANFLEDLGHRLTIGHDYAGGHDLLIALHARKSYEAVRAYRRLPPERPAIAAV